MDRQDIDALLVGALYGELTPADEARLAAHLEAHPADRGALDDLKSARAKVRESRIFEDAGSVEPPQHISALLLQEAHRRAPKRAVATEAEQRDSWFFRVTRVFLAHPAMAAAAMLVLVVGVAGTLYTKKGAHFADRSAPSATTANETAAADQPAAAAGSAAAVAQGSAAYGAGLAEPGDLALDEKESTASDRWRNEKQQENAPAVASAQPKPARRTQGIEVRTEEAQPKDFEGAKDTTAKIATAPAKAAATKGSVAKNDATRDYDGAADDNGMVAPETTTATTTPSNGYGRGAIGGAASGGGGAANTGMAQPPPPPPQAPSGNFAAAPRQDVATDKKKAESVAKAPSTSAPAQAAPAPTATPQDSSLIGWAKSTHAQVIAKVKAGDCQAAAKLALTVSNRAPEYYSQYMATDRQLKSCKQYIDSERDKDAEKANKTRAQKRVNADEAAPAPSTK